MILSGVRWSLSQDLAATSLRISRNDYLSLFSFERDVHSPIADRAAQAILFALPQRFRARLLKLFEGRGSKSRHTASGTIRVGLEPPDELVYPGVTHA